VPDYVEDIDAKHAEKIVECKKKLAEIEKMKNDPAYKQGNALTRGENIYKRKPLSGLSGVQLDISFNTLELVFINNCKDSEFKVTSKTKKIVINDCTNVTVSVDEKVLTSTLEIIRSTGVTLHINVPVWTITCDNSSAISLHFSDIECFDMIAWAKVRDATLFVSGTEIELSRLESANYESDQIITRKGDDTTITSSVTQRDRCGRITTTV